MRRLQVLLLSAAAVMTASLVSASRPRPSSSGAAAASLGVDGLRYDDKGSQVRFSLK